MGLGQRKIHSVVLNLDPAQYLSGWRAEPGTLFLPTVSEGRVGDHVAARIGLFGHVIRATVFGQVALVRRVGRPALPPGVELNIDRTSLPAARFLALAARGERISFRERAPRFLAARPLRLVRDGGEQVALTLNVSEGGCALSWSGPLPLVGEVLSAKVGEGIFAAGVRLVVCWNAPGGVLERSVGLRVVAEGRGARAWRSVVAEAERTGAAAA
ncbi:MAG: pilus assembly protein PilZ [Anaeromyxobacteraceae bacterium]